MNQDRGGRGGQNDDRGHGVNVYRFGWPTHGVKIEMGISITLITITRFCTKTNYCYYIMIKLYHLIVSIKRHSSCAFPQTYKQSYIPVSFKSYYPKQAVIFAVHKQAITNVRGLVFLELSKISRLGCEICIWYSWCCALSVIVASIFSRVKFFFQRETI